MATVTLGVTTVSTSNATSYAAGAFTPSAGDVLIALISSSDTVHTSWTNGGSVTDDQGGVWDKIVSRSYSSSAHSMSAWLRRGKAAAASTIVTFDCTGDAASGAAITVFRIASAEPIVRGYAHASGAASSTPSVTMPQAVLTGNPVVGVVGNNTNPAGITEPASWTESSDTGYTGPTSGHEACFRNSGETNTTISWGSTSASAHGEIVVEIYNGGTGPEMTMDHSPSSGFFGVQGGPG